MQALYSPGLLPVWWPTSDCCGGLACVQSLVSAINCDCAIDINRLSHKSLALGALAVVGADTCGTQEVARDAGVAVVTVHPIRYVGAAAEALVGEGHLCLLDHQAEVPAPGAHPVPLPTAAVTLLMAGPADLPGSLVMVRWALGQTG